MQPRRLGGLLQDLEHGDDLGTHLSSLLWELTVLARKGQRSPSGYFVSLALLGEIQISKKGGPEEQPCACARGGAGSSGKQVRRGEARRGEAGRGGVTRGDAGPRGTLPRAPGRFGLRRSA